MKNFKISISFVLLLFVYQNLLAQKTPFTSYGTTIVGETKLNYDGNPHPAFEIRLQGEHKSLVKNWQNFFKDNYSVKLKRSGDKFIGESIYLSDISPKTLTLVSLIDNNGMDVKLVIALSDNGLEYFSKASYPHEAAKIEDLLKRFSKYYHLVLVEEESSNLQKPHGKMLSDLKKVEKDKEKVLKKLAKEEDIIFDAESDIRDNEKKIMELQTEITELNNEIAASKANVDALMEQNRGLDADIQVQKERMSVHGEKIDNVKEKKKLIISE